MATYLMLVRLTGQGVKNSLVRIETARGMLGEMGAELKQVYHLMGHYDMALVVEAPNYEAMAKAALTLDSLGSMRTETLRAFSEDEYRKILDDIA